MVDVEKIPVICDNLTIKKMDDEIIIVSEAGDEMHTLDDVGSYIWSLIDGNNSFAVICKSILKNYNTTYETAEKDLKVFLGGLNKKGLIFFKN